MCVRVCVSVSARVSVSLPNPHLFEMVLKCSSRLPMFSKVADVGVKHLLVSHTLEGLCRVVSTKIKVGVERGV